MDRTGAFSSRTAPRTGGESALLPTAGKNLPNRLAICHSMI
jgi:hypothetical protein